jgi:hypothetical protein
MCKVHRNHRNGVPWHPLHRRQRGTPMHSYVYSVGVTQTTKRAYLDLIPSPTH